MSKDSAVSPTIAVVLIIALTVLLAAITGAVLLSNSNLNSAAPISGITITEKNGIVTFTHFSGETLKAGEYKIILDSKTIEGTTDFGPGNILNYEAENINHAAIVSTAKGNEAIIAEKYFGGSGVLVKKVDVEVIGFTSSSDLLEKGEKIDQNGKYEVVYGSESNMGVIIKLSGDYVGEVNELKDVKVGSLKTKKLESSEYPYCYSIPIEKAGNKYSVSGNIFFNDNTVQEFKAEDVYIPGESELTFRIDSYAKYKTGDFSSSDTNKYVGHGITVEITGGTRKDDVVPFDKTGASTLNYKVEVTMVNDVELTTGDTYNKNGQLVEDDTINNGDIKYYYIKNAEAYRAPFDVEEYNITIKFTNDEIKKYTFNRKDASLKDIINFHIYAWSPLHEDNWRIDPIEPFDVNIEPYLSTNKDQHGVKVTVSNGYFPDMIFAKKRINNINIFPVDIKVTLTSPDNEEIQLVCDKDVSSIGNEEYIFIIASDEYKNGINAAEVNAVFTMTDKEMSDGCNIRSKSFESENTLDIPKLKKSIDSPIEVTVEGYQKGLAIDKTGNTIADGHGIKITAKIKEGIDTEASYYLGVTLSNKTTDKTIDYTLNGDPNYLKYDSGLSKINVKDDGEYNNANYLKIIQNGNYINKDGISYLYIGPTTDGSVNNNEIKNAEVKLDLYKYSDGKLKFIKNIYDDTINIPPRTLPPSSSSG